MPVLGLVTIGSLIISVDQIKETIMKKIIFWTALISVVTLFIGACAKRDDTTITATAVTCDRTASGSITIGSDTVSSSYLMDTPTTPETGCYAMTNAGFPTGTQSLKQQRIITSSTSFVDYTGYFFRYGVRHRHFLSVPKIFERLSGRSSHGAEYFRRKTEHCL